MKLFLIINIFVIAGYANSNSAQAEAKLHKCYQRHPQLLSKLILMSDQDVARLQPKDKIAIAPSEKKDFLGCLDSVINFNTDPQDKEFLSSRAAKIF